MKTILIHQITLTIHEKEQGLFALTANSSSILILSFSSVFSSSISSTCEQTKLSKVYQLRRYPEGDRTNAMKSGEGRGREREEKTCGLPLIVSRYRFSL